MKKSHYVSGIIALIALTAIYGITAVMARYFSDSTSVLEQWYIRYSLATIMMAVFFHHKIRFRRFLRAPNNDLLLLGARAIIGFVIGAGLYALATQKTDIASVAILQVVPTTALLGVVVLGEKLSKAKLSLITVSFFGALFVLIPDLNHTFRLGVGEWLSLVSGTLFSLSFVLRKKQTDFLNNYELAFGTLATGAVANYLLNALLFHKLAVPTVIFTPTLGLLFVGAAILSVCMSLLSNYGFEHVRASVASVILDLELLFGIFFGYLFYREVLSWYQAIGAFIILTSAITMSVIDNRGHSVVAPTPE